MMRSRVLICLAGALIVASVISSWIAIGRLAAATQRGLARTEESLASAHDLAVDTASSAAELQRVIGIVGAGLGSTVDALEATRRVSAAVRRIVDVGSIFDRLDDLSRTLTDAETSIAVVEIDLAEASGSIEEAAPILQKEIDSLQAIPHQLERSINEVKSSRARIGQQVSLWRLAVVAGGAALALMLGAIAQLQRSVSRAPGVAANTPTAEEGQP
jgi:hypothetical protein